MEYQSKGPRKEIHEMNPIQYIGNEACRSDLFWKRVWKSTIWKGDWATEKLKVWKLSVLVTLVCLSHLKWWELKSPNIKYSQNVERVRVISIVSDTLSNKLQFWEWEQYEKTW